MMRTRQMLMVALLAGLCACGTEPIQQDQPIVLAADQGLAAVEFDAADPLSLIQIDSDNGTKLSITSVPVGVNLYLFQVPAGDYCFTHFQFGRWNFYAQDKHGQCFQVKAGELGYSGRLSPRVTDGQVMMGQDMDLGPLRVMMGERYPIIAKQFMPPEVPAYTAADLAASPGTTAAPAGATVVIPAVIKPQHAPAAGNDQISDWMEEIPGTRAQVIFFRNNTGWPMEVKRFELYDCEAVKQKCGAQKLVLTLPPHATRQAIIVEPDNLQDAYTFRFRFMYGFLQNEPKH